MDAPIAYLGAHIAVTDQPQDVKVEALATMMGHTYSIRVEDFSIPEAGTVLFDFRDERIFGPGRTTVAKPNEDWRDLTFTLGGARRAVVDSTGPNWIKFTAPAAERGPLVVSWNLCELEVRFLCTVAYEAAPPHNPAPGAVGHVHVPAGDGKLCCCTIV